MMKRKMKKFVKVVTLYTILLSVIMSLCACGSDELKLKTDETFWSTVTDYSKFEPGIYDRFGNLFLPYNDYWDDITVKVKYRGEEQTFFILEDWDNELMDNYDWADEKWISRIKNIYNMDVSDQKNLEKWAKEYEKDCVVILPEVWGLNGICSGRMKNVKTLVLPKTLKVMLNCFTNTRNIVNVEIPSSVNLICFSGSQKKLLKDCPNLSSSSKNQIEKLYNNANSHDEDEVWDYMEIIDGKRMR